ncbi:predicted protein [Naegleria gruberi]|uniref:Predicted protein n=1 Tax=Naegleria gruberi TaxID=5762 RepID=D2VHE9_NAEGR|nr:uncharacterized protein NAEGRDRAFT_68192 [Naegleria gruberi]EFC43790.1 predicted protein [Naegleria gruberi]|eukprot:XP_002676534.1 predicted protein [Naegleria gruberi strain NEG-M]
MSQFKDLRILSLSYNYIEDFRELKYIPASVENLSLEGNPISNHPNYRLNVIENIPQLKILDTKPIKDSERKDIHEANQLADYIPKLLFALDKLCSKTYKDLVMLGAQVEQYRKYGNLSPNNVENEFEFSFPSYIPKNGEYKRCVKRIPPLSDVKDTRITVEGVRNLARNMFDETLINSTLDECNNVAELELDRFKLELKESIVKQYKEVKKYANAVACLEKEQKFVVYSGDQTQLYIFIKCMVQVANQLCKYN